MKKIFCALLMMFVMCSGGFAASEDTRLEGKINALSERIDRLEKRIDTRINELEKKIDAHTYDLEKHISSAINIRDILMYIPLVILGAIIIMVYVAMFIDLQRERKTPFATVEDVRRIVSEILAENNAKIRA